MADLITVFLSLAGSAVTSFVVAKYYGARWVEIIRSRKEHSTKLNDGFFKPLLVKIGDFNEGYCKIDAFYSRDIGQMVPSQPRDPQDLQFYEEAMSHLKSYERLLSDWDKMKQTTLRLNEELATQLEEIRVLIKKELDLPYWCPKYSGDEPPEYLCPTTFVRSIHDEVYWRLKRDTKQFESGVIQHTITGDRRIYHFSWLGSNLVGSPKEELVQKAHRLFSRLVEDDYYRKRVKDFIARQEETYDKEREKVKQDLEDIIKAIDLGKIIKGKCKNCP